MLDAMVAIPFVFLFNVRMAFSWLLVILRSMLLGLPVCIARYHAQHSNPGLPASAIRRRGAIIDVANILRRKGNRRLAIVGIAFGRRQVRAELAGGTRGGLVFLPKLTVSGRAGPLVCVTRYRLRSLATAVYPAFQDPRGRRRTLRWGVQLQIRAFIDHPFANLKKRKSDLTIGLVYVHVAALLLGSLPSSSFNTRSGCCPR